MWERCTKSCIMCQCLEPKTRAGRSPAGGAGGGGGGGVLTDSGGLGDEGQESESGEGDLGLRGAS